MILFDFDIHVSGSLDGENQEDYSARIRAGKFDVIILFPPSSFWSRANWANNKGPPPCRDRFQFWGFADNKKGQRGRADRGNASWTSVFDLLSPPSSQRLGAPGCAAFLSTPRTWGAWVRIPSTRGYKPPFGNSTHYGGFSATTGRRPLQVGNALRRADVQYTSNLFCTRF